MLGITLLRLSGWKWPKDKISLLIIVDDDNGGMITWMREKVYGMAATLYPFDLTYKLLVCPILPRRDSFLINFSNSRFVSQSVKLVLDKSIKYMQFFLILSFRFIIMR